MFISAYGEMCATIISSMNETYRKAFKALGDPTRLHIVEFLARTCCSTVAIDSRGGVLGPSAGEICCHITGADQITSTVSQHLRELADCGLVQIERRGKHRICTLRSKALQELADYLQKLALEPEEPACCPTPQGANP